MTIICWENFRKPKLRYYLDEREAMRQKKFCSKIHPNYSKKIHEHKLIFNGSMLLQRIYSDFGKCELVRQSSRCVVSCLKVLELGETYKYQNKFITVSRCQGIQL